MKEADIFFFDESRFGTQSIVGYSWFQKNQPAVVKKKCGYENTYLYSATNHVTGRHFTLEFPFVNTDCMNIFLKEMSFNLKRKITIIMDNASWHKSKALEIPANIEIIYLPPYSPELNPVERLWLYIKQKVMKNRVFENLEQLSIEIGGFIKNLSNDVIKSVCGCGYLFS